MEISTFPLTAGRRYSAAKLEIVIEHGSGGRVGGREAMSGNRPHREHKDILLLRVFMGHLTYCVLGPIPGARDTGQDRHSPHPQETYLLIGGKE